MKILIVDDEPIIRTSIVEIVQSSSLPFHKIQQATNGSDALSILRNDKPDILLTDIKMPGFDGISLLKELQKENLETIVIFITGFPNFEYAQSAVKYGAFDYLLKPITNDVLIDCLKEAIKAHTTNKRTKKLSQTLSAFYQKNENLLRKQSLESLLISPSHNLETITTEQLSVLCMGNECFRLVGIRCNAHNKSAIQYQEYFITYTLANEMTTQYPQLPVCTIGNVIYVLFGGQTDEELVEVIKSFSSAISTLSHDRYYSALVFCVSDPWKDLNDIHKLNHQIQQCFINVHNEQDNTISELIFYSDIDDSNVILLEINECISHLVTSVQHRDSKTSAYYTNQFFELIEDEPFERQRDAIDLVKTSLHCCFIDYSASSSIPESLTHAMDNCSPYTCSIEQCRDSFSYSIQQIIQELSSLSVQHSDKLIQAVNEFISKNYMRQIGLSDIAEYLGRNPSYVSRLLSQKLNKGFLQLLTEKRMSIAKEMLTNTNLRVSEIAELSGYASAKYFNQVFMNKIGMTPSDYRLLVNQF